MAKDFTANLLQVGEQNSGSPRPGHGTALHAFTHTNSNEKNQNHPPTTGAHFGGSFSPPSQCLAHSTDT